MTPRTIRALRARHALPVAAIAAVAITALPSAASASTVRIGGANHVIYEAAPGELNQVTISDASQPNAFIVSDPGARIIPGPGCLLTSPSTAFCNGQLIGLVREASIYLGDLSDSADNRRHP